MWDGDLVCRSTSRSFYIVPSPLGGMETFRGLSSVVVLDSLSVLSPLGGMETWEFVLSTVCPSQGSEPTVWDGDSFSITSFLNRSRF